MKVIFITTGHGHDDDRVTRKEALSLARLGYDITVCAQYNNSYVEPSIKFIDIDAVEYIKGDTPSKGKTYGRFGRCLRVRNLYRAYKKVCPDLVVAHEFESACLARWIRRRNGTPYVFDDHEAYEETIPKIFPRIIRPIIKWLVKSELKRIVRDSCGITAAVPKLFAYEEAQRIGKSAKVLYNSTWLKYFPYGEDDANPITIFQEGNLSRDRGAYQILDALAIVSRSHDFKLVVIGKIMPDVEGEYQMRIKRLGLEDKIQIKGYLPWDEFGQLEKDGQIGLCCLQRTHNCIISLACKLFSYSACGLAIIGMENSETERFLNDAGNGICVDTTSPKEIANAIIWLIEHPEERRMMARNGRKAIEEKYCWERMEEVMKNFYGDIFDRTKN